MSFPRPSFVLTTIAAALICLSAVLSVPQDEAAAAFSCEDAVLVLTSDHPVDPKKVTGGSLLTLDLSNAEPNAQTWMIIGTATIFSPFKGCILVPRPDFIVDWPTTDASGASSAVLLWPAGAPPNASFFFQAWFMDPDGPAGFGDSNGDSVTVR